MAITDPTAAVPANPKSLNLLGIIVTPMTVEQIIDVMRRHVESRQRCVISSMNLHGIYNFRHDASFRALNGQSLVRVDGMPIVWIGRLLGQKINRSHRVTWVDLIGPVLRHAAANGWRIFYLGGRLEVLSAGLAEIGRQYPSLKLTGNHGYLDETHAEYLVNQINRFAPDVLLVGMGMPKQEHWINNNADSLCAPVIATAGACIEYLAGVVDTPPRWMGRWGLEWLYRLLKDPRRFWRRYLVECWAVIFFLLRRALGRDRRLYRP